MLLLLLFVASECIRQTPISQHSQASDIKTINARHNNLPPPTDPSSSSSRGFELCLFPTSQGSHRDCGKSSSLRRPHGGGSRTGRWPPARGLRGCGRRGATPARLARRRGTGVCIPHARAMPTRRSDACPRTQCEQLQQQLTCSWCSLGSLDENK